MADNNLSSNAYLKNRLQYHAASRVAIQTGQALAQATNADGHIVTTGKVWASPMSEFVTHETAAMKTTSDGIAATEDLVTRFKTAALLEKELNGGYVWTNTSYPAVKLYENVEMTGVSGSNGSGSKYEAYEILDSGVRVADLIPPTAVIENGLPVPGYTGRVQVSKDNGTTWTDLENVGDVSGAWALAEGNWETIYIAGMVTFHPSYTPVGKGYSKIRFTGFKYIGKYLNSSISTIEDMLTWH